MTNMTKTFRFWDYLKLLIIMTIVWHTETDVWEWDSVTPSPIVHDLINCYSAALISVIFVFKRDIHSTLFKQYGALIGTEDAEDAESIVEMGQQ